MMTFRPFPGATRGSVFGVCRRCFYSRTSKTDGNMAEPLVANCKQGRLVFGVS